jgi:hypothetical protein
VLLQLRRSDELAGLMLAGPARAQALPPTEPACRRLRRATPRRPCDRHDAGRASNDADVSSALDDGGGFSRIVWIGRGRAIVDTHEQITSPQASGLIRRKLFCATVGAMRRARRGNMDQRRTRLKWVAVIYLTQAAFGFVVGLTAPWVLWFQGRLPL